MTTVQIILVCVFCVLALAGGVLAWWVDNGGTFKKDRMEEDNKENIKENIKNNNKSKSSKEDINEKN